MALSSSLLSNLKLNRIDLSWATPWRSVHALGDGRKAPDLTRMAMCLRLKKVCEHFFFPMRWEAAGVMCVSTKCQEFVACPSDM
jgi:hypothetical protein